MERCTNPFKGFPLAAYFIIGTELCERFNYYGMRAILSLYLVGELGYSQDEATGIYHAFNFVAYTVPMLGAIAADSFFGKFFTILGLSLVYASGSVVLAFGATDATIAVTFTIIGLVLIAVGTGGIKPCVVAFGAQQFPDTPEREKLLSNYFATFYFAINLGTLISLNLTPTLRTEVRCFGKNSCYSLAFGLPALLMVIATVLFIGGCFFYTMDRPKENIILKFVCCVSRAIANSICHREKGVKKEHYIDYSDDKYDSDFRSDVRRVFSIIVIFLPVPIFWALYDQQGSRWTFQANNMDGEVGDNLYIIKPDQIQSIDPLLVLILVPLCQLVVYPLCRKFRWLVTPLQRLCTGGMIAVISFIVTALLELEVEATYDLGLVSGKSQLKVVNGLNCPLSVSADAGGEKFAEIIERLDMWQLDAMPVSCTKELNMNMAVPPGCVGELTSHQTTGLTIKEQTANFYFVSLSASNGFNVIASDDFKDPSRSPEMMPKIGVMYLNRGTFDKKLKLTVGQLDTTFVLVADAERSRSTEFTIMDATKYDVSVDGKSYNNIKLRMGGVYMMTLVDDDPPKLVEIVAPNSIHMLWQIPQYIVITVAEVMFSVAGLEFAYTEAPATMRSLVQSLWLFTTATGNVIVTIVATAKLFNRQLYEYFFFAGLMFLDMLVFLLLSVKYKYMNQPGQQTEAVT